MKSFPVHGMVHSGKDQHTYNSENVVYKKDSPYLVPNGSVVLRLDPRILMKRSVTVLSMYLMIVLSVSYVFHYGMCFTNEQEMGYYYSSSPLSSPSGGLYYPQYGHVEAIPLSQSPYYAGEIQREYSLVPDVVYSRSSLPSIPDGFLKYSPMTMEPKICHNVSCPMFKVITSFPMENMEVREYMKSNWVSTEMTISDSSQFQTASEVAKQRLLSYLRGDNVRHIQLELTAPVLHEIKGRTLNGSMIIRFSTFLSEVDMPKPLNPLVHLSYSDTKKVAVLSFYRPVLDMSQLYHQATQLFSLMRKHSVPTSEVLDKFALAKYEDFTGNSYNVLNEIWIELPLIPTAISMKGSSTQLPEDLQWRFQNAKLRCNHLKM